MKLLKNILYKKYKNKLWSLIIFSWVLAACQSEKLTQFQYVTSSDTGITFENTIIESDTFIFSLLSFEINGIL